MWRGNLRASRRWGWLWTPRLQNVKVTNDVVVLMMNLSTETRGKFKQAIFIFAHSYKREKRKSQGTRVSVAIVLRTDCPVKRYFILIVNQCWVHSYCSHYILFKLSLFFVITFFTGGLRHISLPRVPTVSQFHNNRQRFSDLCFYPSPHPLSATSTVLGSSFNDPFIRVVFLHLSTTYPSFHDKQSSFICHIFSSVLF